MRKEGVLVDYEFPIQELRAQLAQARMADWEQKRFGAASHQYRWNPPASLEEVEELEQKIGVTLPKEYREFLLQAGNGGAGPFYGLYSMKQVENELTWEMEADKLPMLSPEEKLPPLDMEQEENWMRGCIPIESQGCTYLTCLMVTGPNRGRIVYVESEGEWVFFPKEETFLCWYQRWLREVCNGYRSDWFATNLDGDEQELQAGYWKAETEAEKREILRNMEKFPELSQDTVQFLKTAFLERIEMEDATRFLMQMYHIGPEFLDEFLQKRWQAQRYNAVVQEVWYLYGRVEQEREHILARWCPMILEKLPQLSETEQVHISSILQQSEGVKLKQVRWVFEQMQDPGQKEELLGWLAKFPDAVENLDLWLSLLEERDDLELLNRAIITAPIVNDSKLKERLLQIQKEFSSVTQYEVRAIKPFSRCEQEYRVYGSACSKEKAIWYEEINPQVIGIPRPYFLRLQYFDMVNLHLEQTPPEHGIPIHPLIALAIRNQFQRLPSTAYDWNHVFSKIKNLSLELDRKTVCRWEDGTNTAYLIAPDEYPPAEPFYYCMGDWSVIGRMKQLKALSISRICVEDFSFLTQCTALERLSLCNTNFSDCRLLLQLPKLKSVDLRWCRLEYTEVLESVSFSCRL